MRKHNRLFRTKVIIFLYMMTAANYATECVPFTSLAAASNAQNRFGNDFDDHVINIHFTGVYRCLLTLRQVTLMINSLSCIPRLHSWDSVNSVRFVSLSHGW